MTVPTIVTDTAFERGASRIDQRVILLQAFKPAFGLPSPGPFVMKTEIHLQMMGLAYRRQFDGREGAPKGKLPYINDGGIIVADSTLIRFHLEQKYEVDLDEGLNKTDRALAWAIERLAEDQLYWAMVYSRWGIDENFEKGPARFFDHLPAATQQEARQRQRKAVLRYLDAQGLGRLSDGEIAALTRRSYAALAELLGDKPYLMGARPCGADAGVFAQISSALTPFFNSTVREAAASHANLVAYSSRMMATYFPDFA